LADGVRLVLMDLRGVLTREGVEPIEPKGEQFDPQLHEALTTRAEEGVDAGTVLDVVEKGYRSPDQVIRPARVVVAA
jgi:molecular chaperone GrpE